MRVLERRSGGRTARPDILAIALEGLTAGAALVDGIGRILFANAAARSLIGEPAPETRFLSDLLPQLTLGELRRAALAATPLRAISAGGEAIEIVVRPSGASFVLTMDGVRKAGGDTLTGLADRSRLQAEMVASLARTRRTGSPLALLCLDLDRFKLVNDTLGHPIGDALLRAVAERLRRAVRTEDVVARIGGDEFVVLQTDARDDRAPGILAKRLLDLIGRSYLIQGHRIEIGVSVGIARAPVDAEDPVRLMQLADLALYRAKADGRGAYRFFEPEMDARLRARRRLEGELRKALAAKQFHLLFQPQFDLATDEIEGFEALLRWEHPVRGTLSPAEFLGLADETGLIEPIGDCALRDACAAATAWSEPAIVSVNLSAGQFRKGSLVQGVASALERSGLQPQRLELEISEKTLIEGAEAVLATLGEIRKLGVRISMDGFGNGYSSLSLMRRFPFDKIKIDRSVVGKMSEDPEFRAIIRAVTSLGASLGIRVAAEGVETPEQFAQLRADGCSSVQGFLTGRPASSGAAAALLATARDLRLTGS